MSSMAILAIVALCLWLVVKFLNLQSSPSIPSITCKDQKFCENIIKHCPDLLKPYVPTPLWGLSGHLQTIVHAVVGRVRTRQRESVRRFSRLADGATLTWDEWTPLDEHPAAGDYTIAVCPGIGNSSETVYIWSFVHYACMHGYRCVVLNHLGALRSVKVTSPRIFCYGRTEELDVMLKSHVTRYPTTQMVLVGFSMGGNIVTKYMGQPGVRRAPNILGAVSICQGYDAQRCVSSLLWWREFRRFYLHMMTENMKSIIMRHRGVLFTEDAKARHQLDERKVFMAATLSEFDEAYSRRVNGYKTLEEFYRDNSSLTFLDGIDAPMVFINSRDDPIVPSVILEDVRRHCKSHDRTLLVETEHGGHLGFYEGGFLVPHSVTWMDRLVVQMAHSLVSGA
ncbi:abhydrolase domain-containing protein 2-like [Amphibalanus amphitrite]|uniref:abhydrolase domain-containing protein 2-like n=1 Tax=Amphibalanus amphitrite TaxID=1232801 RepID=UPI001C90A50C|nr:abhydrolase domain-containing protein 2-like [Amphibalanus amphitrite]XP_043221089.1 abhydrolase domain-containing protein 2-like [Amphibalanus amphitrite]XP_043221090.1 abhydrolase domain-containing protein 2-like [Amphibalanus amphitrite]XP_043221091.1 abhydrolase domain-containing protein 2-like [Amphibalanus amphitrite]XP_043221092.1 abhydrolase domain-containing protein 2-like [Amphibalanus amphitrite]XP_043221093.1 abhydrolase domain-containing protein 2-like [Amphibalanus amphitrite]